MGSKASSESVFRFTSLKYVDDFLLAFDKKTRTDRQRDRQTDRARDRDGQTGI